MTRCSECGVWNQDPAHFATKRFQSHFVWVASLWRVGLGLGTAAFIGSMAQSTAFAVVMPQARHITARFIPRGSYRTGWGNIYWTIDRSWWVEEWTNGTLIRNPITRPDLFFFGALTDWLWLVIFLPLLAILVRGSCRDWPERHIRRWGLLIIVLGSIGYLTHLVIIAIDPQPYIINVAELTMGFWFGLPTLVVAACAFLPFIFWFGPSTLRLVSYIFKTEPTLRPSDRSQ